MRALVSGLFVRSLVVGRSTANRDFADVLPSTAAGPALTIAAVFIVLIGILDILFYWPR